MKFQCTENVTVHNKSRYRAVYLTVKLENVYS